MPSPLQMKLGLVPAMMMAFEFRRLGGVITSIGLDGRIYDTDEMGRHQPSARRVKRWRHHILLLTEDAQGVNFDQEVLSELIEQGEVLVLNFEERDAVIKGMHLSSL